MINLPKDHPLMLHYANLRAEDRNQPDCVKIEKFIAGDTVLENLPLDFQVAVFQEVAAMIIRHIRDSAPCPSDLTQDELPCTCHAFDAMLDALEHERQGQGTDWDQTGAPTLLEFVGGEILDALDIYTPNIEGLKNP